MRRLAQACERIAATRKKLEKVAVVAEYLTSRTVEDAAVSAVFLSGSPFPACSEATLQVGGSLLWRTIAQLSGRSHADLAGAYRRLGDLGGVAGEALINSTSTETLSVGDVQAAFREIAMARGSSDKGLLLRLLLGKATALEAMYIVKIATGELRIGLKESLVEEGIAKAHGATLEQVQRANLLLGDIGETARLAAAEKLGEARLRLFHPLGFMLASPAEATPETLRCFGETAVEDKYDGIRAQAHCAGDRVRFFSRTRDEITESFPELALALAGLAHDAVLDGEIVAWTYPQPGLETAGRALPFSALQQRLGRKKVSEALMRRVPVAYLAFDVLYAGDDLLIDRPLRDRREILEGLLAAPRTGTAAVPAPSQALLDFGADGPRSRAQALCSPVHRVASSEEVDRLFAAAQARGNEGLMLKDLNSAYTPGRRGKAWLKIKRELATLDVVVTSVEYGHGKRIGVLSDYTFAVWDGERLVNIGKAYSGLTDAEIERMTKWFLEHAVADQGMRLEVEPKIVLEVAFNNMTLSDRHESGYALRFPRIVRLRSDKLAEEADTIEQVKQIYEKQGK